MHSNNEVGTLQPIREIAALTRAKGVLLHTDAAQSTGKLPLDVEELGVDLLTVAGHKLYAPKGVGVLYVRRGVKLEPLVHGAGHEGGRRAGTENVPYIVGLGDGVRDRPAVAAGGVGAAAAVARPAVGPAAGRPGRPRQPQRPSGKAAAEHAQRQLRRAASASELLEKTPEVAASTGSACHEGKVTQSPVLCAMGVPPELGRGALRLTVGRFTTEDERSTGRRRRWSGARDRDFSRPLMGESGVGPGLDLLRAHAASRRQTRVAAAAAFQVRQVLHPRKQHAAAFRLRRAAARPSPPASARSTHPGPHPGMQSVSAG